MGAKKGVQNFHPNLKSDFGVFLRYLMITPNFVFAGHRTGFRRIRSRTFCWWSCGPTWRPTAPTSSKTTAASLSVWVSSMDPKRGRPWTSFRAKVRRLFLVWLAETSQITKAFVEITLLAQNDEFPKKLAGWPFRIFCSAPHLVSISWGASGCCDLRSGHVSCTAGGFGRKRRDWVQHSDGYWAPTGSHFRIHAREGHGFGGKKMGQKFFVYSWQVGNLLKSLNWGHQVWQTKNALQKATLNWTSAFESVSDGLLTQFEVLKERPRHIILRDMKDVKERVVSGKGLTGSIPPFLWLGHSLTFEPLRTQLETKKTGDRHKLEMWSSVLVDVAQTIFECRGCWLFLLVAGL